MVDIGLLGVALSPIMLFVGLLGGTFVHPISRAWILRKMMRKNYGVILVAVKGMRLEPTVANFNDQAVDLGGLGTYLFNSKKVYVMKGLPVQLFEEGDTTPLLLEEVKKQGKVIDSRMATGYMIQQQALANAKAWKDVRIILIAAIVAAVLSLGNLGLSFKLMTDLAQVAAHMVISGAAATPIPVVG